MGQVTPLNHKELEQKILEKITAYTQASDSILAFLNNNTTKFIETKNFHELVKRENRNKLFNLFKEVQISPAIASFEPEQLRWFYYGCTHGSLITHAINTIFRSLMYSGEKLSVATEEAILYLKKVTQRDSTVSQDELDHFRKQILNIFSESQSETQFKKQIESIFFPTYSIYNTSRNNGISFFVGMINKDIKSEYLAAMLFGLSLQTRSLAGVKLTQETGGVIIEKYIQAVNYIKASNSKEFHALFGKTSAQLFRVRQACKKLNT